VESAVAAAAAAAATIEAAADDKPTGRTIGSQPSAPSCKISENFCGEESSRLGIKNTGTIFQQANFRLLNPYAMDRRKNFVFIMG